MAVVPRRQFVAAQKKVAEGNEGIARLRAVIEFLKRHGEPHTAQEQELKSLIVRHRLNMVELNRLIELTTPAIPTPTEALANSVGTRTVAGPEGQQA
jgi:hypothetical protein